jgi:hypothetical protein
MLFARQSGPTKNGRTLLSLAGLGVIFSFGLFCILVL